MIEPDGSPKPGSDTNPTRPNRPSGVSKGRRVKFCGTVPPLRCSVDGRMTLSHNERLSEQTPPLLIDFHSRYHCPLRLRKDNQTWEISRRPKCVQCSAHFCSGLQKLPASQYSGQQNSGCTCSLTMTLGMVLKYPY